jgi:hypothetical protein
MNDNRAWKPYKPGIKDNLTPKQRENHRKLVEDLTGRSFCDSVHECP